MDVYLIRHADAIPLGEGGMNDDADRALTADGHAQARDLAKALQARGARLGAVVSSPLVRARQTAEDLIQHWAAPAPELRICEEAAPGGSRKALSKYVRGVAADAVAVVGHQPDLGDYAGWLVGSKKAHVEIAKAGFAHITFDDGVRKGEGVLLSLLSPDWMR
jgi:phosphohistidine phosphatase